MLSTIKLANFRGYGDLSLDLPGHLTVLVGDNAQGKTNFLRAVEVLGLGDPRELSGGNLLKFGAASGCVEGGVDRDGIRERLVAGLSGRGVKLAVNGKTVTRPRWVGRLPVLFLGPEDREQVMGPPSARRELLDELLEQCEPAYLSSLRDFRRALKQRNRALSRCEESTPGEVEIWDAPLATAGGVLLALRVQALEALAPRARAWHRELTGTEGDLAVSYQSTVDAAGGKGSPAAWTEALLATLAAQRSRELAWGGTLFGPHRDDVAISLDGRALKGTGSSGEVWGAIIAFTLASAEHLGGRLGRLPLLLLDDVLLALDARRRERLLSVLQGFPQAFLAATSCPANCAPEAVYEVREHALHGLGREEVAAAAWQRRN